MKSINYALYFGSANIQKHCLYLSAFTTDTYRRIIFSCSLLFKLFLSVSKLCEWSH